MQLSRTFVRWASLTCFLPWMGLAQVANGDFEIDSFGAAGITDWTGGAAILGQPPGSPLIPPFNTPPPPIGSSGNCAAGIPSGAVLRQTLAGEAGHGYTLGFSAKSMSGLAAGRLRVRVSKPDSTVLAERVPALQTGGAGADGFSRYTLEVPTLDATGPLVVEFANTQTMDSRVAVDDVRMSASQPSAPPVLAAPEKQATQWKVAWTEPSFGYVLQRSTSWSSGWTDVTDTTLRRENGRLFLWLGDRLADPTTYFRLQARP